MTHTLCDNTDGLPNIHSPLIYKILNLLEVAMHPVENPLTAL
jgi:hypothetical protein